MEIPARMILATHKRDVLIPRRTARMIANATRTDVIPKPDAPRWLFNAMTPMPVPLIIATITLVVLMRCSLATTPRNVHLKRATQYKVVSLLLSLVTIMTLVPTTHAIPVKVVFTPLFRATMRMNVPLTHAIPPADVLMYPYRVTMMICVPQTPVYLARDVLPPRLVATITMHVLTIIAHFPLDVPMFHLPLRIATIRTHVPEITATLVPDVTTQINLANATIQMPAQLIVVT